jgi:quercetin dioxygenase-like cupin family protein
MGKQIWAALLVLGAASPAAAADKLDLKTDAISAGIPQELQLTEQDYKAGEGSGWHIQHGIELAYVMQGEVQLTVGKSAKDKTGPQIFHAGDSFKVGRDTPHDVVNVGSGDARLIVSYMLDRGSMTRILVMKPVWAK